MLKAHNNVPFKRRFFIRNRLNTHRKPAISTSQSGSSSQSGRSSGDDQTDPEAIKALTRLSLGTSVIHVI